jgi:NNP family nitrate/nitrite transporter-like MFS transporter
MQPTPSSSTLHVSPRQGLIGATLGFFIGFAAIALFGPLAQKFKEPLQLTPAMIGLLVATPSLSGSLLRIPFSAWVDSTGGRKPLLVLLGLSVAGMVGVFGIVALFYPARLTPAFFPLLLLLGALCGCGAATFSVGISQVSYWFPRHQQGSALGTYAGIGNLAPGIFTLLLPAVLEMLGLPGTYLAWLILLVGGALLYARIGLNAPYFQLLAAGKTASEAQRTASQFGQEIFPIGSTRDSLMASARAWRTWALVGVYFVTQGGFLTMTAWLPTYWKSFYGTTLLAAGLLTAFYAILTSLIRVYGGKLSDRIGGEKTAYLALSALLAGAVLMSVSHIFGLSLLATILLGLGMGIGNAAVFKLVPKFVPRAVGGASGWVGGLGAFGGFMLPPLLGVVVNWRGDAGYASGFGVFIGLALLAMGLIRLLNRPLEMKSA